MGDSTSILPSYPSMRKPAPLLHFVPDILADISRLSLRGPAPIHHAILRGDEHMGVSLQTLDHRQFDHGVILSQTPKPGLRMIKHPTLSRPQRKLALECADILVQGLRDGKHVPPHEDAGWKAAELVGQPLRHAPKITKADMEVDWRDWTPEDWSRRLQLQQAVWTMGQVQPSAKSGGKNTAEPQRIIFHDATQVPAEEVTGHAATMELVSTKMGEAEAEGEGEGEGDKPTRLRKTVHVDSRKGNLYVLLYGDTWLRLRRATLQGKKENAAAASVKSFIFQ